MHDRLWFELGWDFASYDIRTPDEAPPEMLTGHREGKARFRKPVGDADRYVRKWLQLRFNALRRNRHFDADVDPDFLRSIDTHLCPVTNERLTRGAMAGTDWSVDRVVNDGAYCRANLVIMSTRANAAKSAMSIEEVVAQVRMGDACNTTLKPVEWRRLLSLIYSCHRVVGAVQTDYEEHLPINPDYPRHLPHSLELHLQLFFTVLATDRAYKGRYAPPPLRAAHQVWLKEVKRASSGIGLQILHKMLTKMERKALTVECPALLMWIPSIFELYLEWLETLPDFDQLVTLRSHFVSIDTEAKAKRSDAMHRNVKGYIPHA